jgi:tripartite-type tricarboxylate transporter receptor subunit TctC
MMNRRFLISCCLALSVAGTAQAQTASGYPNKPVKFVVAFAPGGPADIIARLLGQRLSESIGQPVVIENRGGAGGSLASGIVAKVPADGYTLMINTSSYAVNTSLAKNPSFDAEKDFVLASVVASSPNLLVSFPGLKAKNLQEIMAEAKSGKLNYGSAGAGTTPHLTAEYLFKVLGKVDVTHIPFQGAGPALAATMGGQVEMASVALPAAVEMVKGGKVRGLAVTSNKRVASMPDVPTVAESGFPGFEDYTWVGVFAPSKTSPEIVNYLNLEVGKILRSADFQAKLAGVGFEPVGGTPKEAGDYLKVEITKWAKIIKETGVKVD